MYVWCRYGELVISRDDDMARMLEKIQKSQEYPIQLQVLRMATRSVSDTTHEQRAWVTVSSKDVENYLRSQVKQLLTQSG